MVRGRPRSVAQRHTHNRGWALLAGERGQVVARSRAPLVGRRRELQFIGDRMELAEAGRPQGVVVTGPTGVGKSRLAREVRDRAGASGFQDVVIAAGLGDGIPFAPLTHQLLPLLVESFGADEAYRGDLAVLEVLAAPGTVVPDGAVLRDLLHQADGPSHPAVTATDTLGDGDTEPALWVDDRHHELVQRLLTLTRLTIEASQRRPLLVVIDDLQAADPATATYIDQLLVTADRVARHEEVPLLVLALHRAEPGHGDDDPARLPGCEVLALAGLDRIESLDLLTALGADTTLPEVEAAVRAAEGSPLFLEAASRTMLGPSASASSSLAGIPIPETIVDAIAGELEELPADCRATLADLALLAAPVTVEAASFLLGLDDAELAHRLRPALDDGTIEVDGEHLRFTHGLRRMAAAAARGPLERASRHLAHAEQLLATDPAHRPAGPTLVAHHLVEAGAHADPELVVEHTSAAAAGCLDRGAYLDAVRYYEAALLAGPDRSAADRGRLHLGAARAWVGALDVARAGSHAEQAASLFEQADDRRRWAEAVLLRFRCVVYRARYGATPPPVDDLERVQRDEELPESLRIESLITASELTWIQAEPDTAARLADEAHQRAHAAGLDALASASLVSRSTSAWMRLDLRGARRLLDEAERLADRAEDDLARSVAAGRTAYTCWLLGDVDVATEAARRAASRADDAGRQLERAMPLAVQTAVAVARGDRSGAEMRADEVVLIQRASGDWWTAPFVFGPLAYAAVLAGDERDLPGHLRALRDGLGGDAGASIGRALALWSRALLGHPRATDADSLRSLHDPAASELFPPPGVGVASLAAAFVDAIDALDTGTVPDVLHDRLLQAEARGQVMASTLPMLVPRVLAAVSRLAGDLRTAERAAWRAIEIGGAAGLSAELARSHLEVARIAHLQDRPDDAGRHVETFLDLCTTHRLHGLVDLAGRLPDMPVRSRVLRAGGSATAPGCPVAVAADLTTHAWLSDRAGGPAKQHVRRQVLYAIGQQVEAFDGYGGAGVPLVAWFPSVRLAVEFSFRAVARARRRGVSIGVGIELASGSVASDDAVRVATSLCQLASADEVLVSDRARGGPEHSPGLDFRYHSAGRVDGADEPLTISRARLTRTAGR